MTSINIEYEQIRQQIAYTKAFHKQEQERQVEERDSLGSWADLIQTNNKKREALYAHLPPLPPSLSQPQYAREPNLIGGINNDNDNDDDQELDLYLACQHGHLDKVITIVKNLPKTIRYQAILQYGLQQAASANQPLIAQVLFEAGAILHTDVFDYSLLKPDGSEEYHGLLHQYNEGQNLIPLMQVFINSGGWHPNQQYSTFGRLRFALLTAVYTKNTRLIEFLISQGADLHFGTAEDFHFLPNPLDRQSGEIFNAAIAHFDPELLKLLTSYGINPKYSRHLLNLVQSRANNDKYPHPYTKSFSEQRQATAEYLLSLDSVDINDVKEIPWQHFYPAVPPHYKEPTTALAYACAGQDWEFVRWLLEQGADPTLLYGKATERQWWIQSDITGANGPEVIEKIISEVRGSINVHKSD